MVKRLLTVNRLAVAAAAALLLLVLPPAPALAGCNKKVVL